MDANEKGIISVIAKQLRDLRQAFTTLSKESGPQGIQGKDGLRGHPGPRGPVGPPGADGKDGVDGVDGSPGAPGRDGQDGTPGVDGKDGVDGQVGPMPKHEWQGTKLRFQQTAKRWGKWVDLGGKKSGAVVVAATADGATGFDPDSLPVADFSPTPTEVIVKQNGVWVRATWVQFTGWIGSVGPTGVTVNGETVTVNGETVTVNGA